MTKASDDGITESSVHGVLQEGDNCTVTSMGQNLDEKLTAGQERYWMCLGQNKLSVVS